MLGEEGDRLWKHTARGEEGWNAQSESQLCAGFLCFHMQTGQEDKQELDVGCVRSQRHVSSPEVKWGKEAQSGGEDGRRRDKLIFLDTHKGRVRWVSVGRSTMDLGRVQTTGISMPQGFGRTRDEIKKRGMQSRDWRKQRKGREEQGKKQEGEKERLRREKRVLAWM